MSILAVIWDKKTDSMDFFTPGADNMAKTFLHARLFATAFDDHFRVALDEVGDVEVSTVLLTAVPVHEGSRPRPFETAVDSRPYARWATSADALRGHEHVVRLLKRGELKMENDDE